MELREPQLKSAWLPGDVRSSTARAAIARTAGKIAAPVRRSAIARVDAASLALFRIIFGLVGVFIVARFFAYGWIGELYVEPANHFSYVGFGWVKPWPGWGMYAHFAVLGALALGIAVGFCYRLCALLFFLGFTYVELLDKTVYLNHYYWTALVSLFMVFLPLQRSLSVDAWLESRTLWGTAPLAALWLFRAQLAAVYVFAGVAKLNPDWLLKAQPLYIWLQDHTGLPLVGPLLGEVWVAYVFSWGGAMFDLTIVAWLLCRRTRPVAYAVLVAFHVMTYLLFPQIGVFPWLMIAAALLFFQPDWPRQVLHRLWRQPRVSQLILGSPAPPRPAPELRPRANIARRALPWLAVGAIAVYAATQLMVPLRHYAYPGNVRWNEEGYRFSWRVLVTEKVGMVEYRVYNPATGQKWRADPGEYLTPLQAERMATQPDMILETAHIIATDFAARGHGPVQVRADVFVAMNGMESARLIDPEVDLASIGHSLARKAWILPER